MSATILLWALVVAQILLAVAMGCAVFRLLIGPRAQDRILALAKFLMRGEVIE